MRENATYQDVVDAPEHKIAEILGGKLYISPLLPPLHSVARMSLNIVLGNAFDRGIDGPGGWWILRAPELHFGTSPNEDVIVPDVVGWQRQRLPKIPDVPYMTLPPDWVCEIVTPVTRELDTGIKSDTYARAGVPHLWLIDPVARTLEAIELQNGKWKSIATLSGNAQVALPPFEAASFSLNELWS